MSWFTVKVISMHYFRQYSSSDMQLRKMGIKNNTISVVVGDGMIGTQCL